MLRPRCLTRYPFLLYARLVGHQDCGDSPEVSTCPVTTIQALPHTRIGRYDRAEYNPIMNTTDRLGGPTKRHQWRLKPFLGTVRNALYTYGRSVEESGNALGGYHGLLNIWLQDQEADTSGS